jgi:hypothetical protein
VPFLVLALLVLMPLAVIVMMPFVLVGRYRAGRARRLARPWLATLNVIATLFSATFFLTVAAVTNLWVPRAFAWAVLGLAAGCGLGVIGLLLSRWEAAPGSLHYTPNRWLVLVITFIVAARVVYGIWRGWNAWGSPGGESSFLTAFGIAGSLAAAATVIGYYAAYSIGLRRRVSQWQRRSLRVMA